ncbi:BglG family transcription antiterminator [Mangrovibacillus sp. Mu-81]|uniref:BglG family transcription antiterminator n=1 Tax=Mangrovibacillus sp. Mu-81 TaxID=3121478 RepID=UPI002FE4557F
MNERQQEIIRILLSQSNRFMLVMDLTDKLECSEKTVRNDLKVIESYLEGYPSAVLIRKPGLGICIEIDENDKAAMYKELQTISGSKGSTLEDEERLIRIAYHLLMSTKSVTVQDLMDSHYASKSVIKKDTDQIETWLSRFNLTLESKQKVGLILEGTEKNKRLALSRLSELVRRPEDTSMFLKKQFPFHEVNRVIFELREMQRNHTMAFTDDSFDRIVIHTLMMVKRTKLHQFISLSDADISFMKKQKEFNWTGELLDKLERFFSIRFPDEERAYLTLHVIGGKLLHRDRDDLGGTDELLSMMTSELVRNLSESNGVKFKEDTELLNGLRVHLYSTLNRLKHGLPVSNVMLQEIKNMYPYMFDQILFALEEINQTSPVVIPEEEAAYLTLHFQASLERLKNQHWAVKKAVVVCHMGIGMSQLLRTKIERKFHTLQVIDCIAHSELPAFIGEHEIDFIISTVPLEGVKKPHIVVSPLLEKGDEDRLEQWVKQINSPEVRSGKSVLLRYTNPFLVFLHLDETNKYDIIKKLSVELHKKGYVEKEYMESSMIRERMAATTVGAGIAIPHGNPRFIRQSVMAAATLKEPVEWGEEKVSLVFMLAVKDDKQENVKQLFREISMLSEDPDRIQSLLRETERMQFLTSLQGN